MKEFITALLQQPYFYISVIAGILLCIVRDTMRSRRKHKRKVDKTGILLDFLANTIFGHLIIFALAVLLAPIDIIRHRMK